MNMVKYIIGQILTILHIRDENVFLLWMTKNVFFEHQSIEQIQRYANYTNLIAIEVCGTS